GRDYSHQRCCQGRKAMSVDTETVRRVAKLARIAGEEGDLERMAGELDATPGVVGRMGEGDVSGLEPVSSVIPIAMKMRSDEVTDGGKADDSVANAPQSGENFFLVPKVVE